MARMYPTISVRKTAYIHQILVNKNQHNATAPTQRQLQEEWIYPEKLIDGNGGGASGLPGRNLEGRWFRIGNVQKKALASKDAICLRDRVSAWQESRSLRPILRSRGIGCVQNRQEKCSESSHHCGRISEQLKSSNDDDDGDRQIGFILCGSQRLDYHTEKNQYYTKPKIHRKFKTEDKELKNMKWDLDFKL